MISGKPAHESDPNAAHAAFFTVTHVQTRRFLDSVVDVTDTSPRLKVSEAARLLCVSDDTVRRWIDSGRLPAVQSDTGRWSIAGTDLAILARALADTPETSDRPVSARNRFAGIVTKIMRDTVMAQVELQAGPFRVVSLISREAADELGLEAGSIAVARVKATSVVIESLELS